ncbi:hypothetical protein B0H13DRAFT_1915140 [Mycena leptocephala]|nr:hypothetical protein B0H13DRAFT_1915140 [Mycena leptocephala]
MAEDELEVVRAARRERAKREETEEKTGMQGRHDVSRVKGNDMRMGPIYRRKRTNGHRYPQAAAHIYAQDRKAHAFRCPASHSACARITPSEALWWAPALGRVREHPRNKARPQRKRHVHQDRAARLWQQPDPRNEVNPQLGNRRSNMCAHWRKEGGTAGKTAALYYKKNAAPTSPPKSTPPHTPAPQTEPSSPPSVSPPPRQRREEAMTEHEPQEQEQDNTVELRRPHELGAPPLLPGQAWVREEEKWHEGVTHSLKRGREVRAQEGEEEVRWESKERREEEEHAQGRGGVDGQAQPDARIASRTWTHGRRTV